MGGGLFWGGQWGVTVRPLPLPPRGENGWNKVRLGVGKAPFIQI